MGLGKPLLVAVIGLMVVVSVEALTIWYSSVFPSKATLQVEAMDLQALKKQARLLGRDAALYARVYWPLKPGGRSVFFDAGNTSMSLVVAGPGGFVEECNTPCTLRLEDQSPYILLDVYIVSMEKSRAGEHYLVVRVAGGSG